MKKKGAPWWEEQGFKKDVLMQASKVVKDNSYIKKHPVLRYIFPVLSSPLKHIRTHTLQLIKLIRILSKITY